MGRKKKTVSKKVKQAIHQKPPDSLMDSNTANTSKVETATGKGNAAKEQAVMTALPSKTGTAGLDDAESEEVADPLTQGENTSSKKHSTVEKGSEKTPLPADDINAVVDADSHRDNEEQATKRAKTQNCDADDTTMFESSCDTAAEKEVKENPRAIRKGAYRKSSKPTIIEKPGDPNDPRTFLSIESNEQKLSAYLEFGDVSFLRRFAMSWPVIKAYLKFDPISLHLNKNSVFHLLADRESNFKDVKPEVLWPLENAGDTEGETKNKKARHLACILLELESDILSLSKLSSVGHPP